MVGIDVYEHGQVVIGVRYLDHNELKVKHRSSGREFYSDKDITYVLGFRAQKNNSDGTYDGVAYVKMNGKVVAQGPMTAGKLEGFHDGAYGVQIPVGAKMWQGLTVVRFYQCLAP